MLWIRGDSSKQQELPVCFGTDQQGHDNVNHFHATKPYFIFPFGLLLLLALRRAN